jgi:hypothetical protein
MEIKLLTSEDLNWPMGTQDNVPQYKIGRGHGRTMKVDPYPCYAPDINLVRILVQQCEELFPLPDASTGFWLMSNEDVSRFNGVTYHDSVYYKPDGTSWSEKVICGCGCGKEKELYHQSLDVCLSGKRIPIHPAMLRYLVSHEYGHMVFHYAARKLGFTSYDDEQKLYREYMSLRKATNFTEVYSGGKWHTNPGEIFANDFRVLFTGLEVEFWPHEVPLPFGNQDVLDWWQKACTASGAKFNPVAPPAKSDVWWANY